MVPFAKLSTLIRLDRRPFNAARVFIGGLDPASIRWFPSPSAAATDHATASSGRAARMMRRFFLTTTLTLRRIRRKRGIPRLDEVL